MNLVTLECPLCRAMVQVDTAAAGQQVACPHCRGTMQVPAAEAFAAGAAEAPPPIAPPPAAVGAMSPPRVGAISYMPVELVSLACPVCGSLFQVPPSAAGMQLPCPACRQLVTIPAPTAGEPGAPPVSVPPAAAAPPVDASMQSPPCSGPPPFPALNSTGDSGAATRVDSLLPPGAGYAGGLLSTEVALPSAPRPILAPRSEPPAGSMLVHTPDGNVVALRERPKVLGEGADEVEIKRLSPAEKARRRMVRSVILFILCLGCLLAFVIYMSR